MHRPVAPLMVPAPGVILTVAVVVLVPTAIHTLASVTVKVYMPVAAVVAADIVGF
jgi:hypothetical protein